MGSDSLIIDIAIVIIIGMPMFYLIVALKQALGRKGKKVD